MKFRRIFASLGLWLLTGAAVAAPAQLRILYVGTDPRKAELSEAERMYPDPPRILARKKARTPDFEKFLGEHFRTVKVVYSDAYRESMSASYEVTIFDATPPVIRDSGATRSGETGQTRATPHYLSARFSDAAILINETSPKLSEPLQYKMDWMCLCLDAHAHGMKLDHPMFNTPNRIHPTLEFRPTPKSYRNYFGGPSLPATMPMWRVQKEGYLDGQGFPPGLVSSGGGFVDASDSEVISNGVCTRGADAVALGRHGNFFHWGFSASPAEMTDEGRLAFVNAIHYIAKFKGQHPYSKRPPRSYTREAALHAATMIATADYDEWVSRQRTQHEGRKTWLRRLQATGTALSAADLKALDAPEPQLMDRDRWVKREVLRGQPENVVALFGTDLDKYLPYYEMHLEYLHPGSSPSTFVVDEDVRSLAVSNRDVQLLDLCLALLESGLETDRAGRILARYTGETFQSAAQWRQWLDKNRGKLYFSDVDGFRFHVAPAPLQPSTASLPHRSQS